MGIEFGGLGGERGGSPHWRYFTADQLGCQVDIKLDPVGLRLLILQGTGREVCFWAAQVSGMTKEG